MDDRLAKLPDVNVLPPDRNPAAVYLASLAESGRAGMLSRLRKVAGLVGHEDPGAVPWHEMRYSHVEAIIARLRDDDEAPATVNMALAALRGIAKAAFNLELINADELTRIRNVKRVRGERLPRGRALASGELGALMRACGEDEGPAGIRDGALVALLYVGGLRRAEVVALDVGDHDGDTGGLVVRGKGNKERSAFINGGAADAMADWLVMRGEDSGALFLPINKGGRIIRERRGEPARLTSQAIYNMLKKRALQAGVKSFSPHDLRRTCISDLLDAGADLAMAQAVAGHASPETTSKYDRRGDAAKKRAAGLLHVPYQRKTLPLTECR